MTFHAQLTMSPEAQEGWETVPTVSHHNLADSSLFSDEALIELLDTDARRSTYALHMGNDLLKQHENQLALHDHLNGEQLLEAVKVGRLWLNITQIGTHAPGQSALVTQLYEQIADTVPGFVPSITSLTLLVSSPKAMVYYHVDGPANMLWHIRGQKRVWIYPPEDKYISQVDLEDIFSAAKHEYVPYTPDFDGAATVVDLEPGMVASWQPNSPHRVVNGDTFNVSLSTEHFTPSHRRKARVYQANRFMRNRLGLSNLSTKSDGLGSIVKQAAWAAANRLGQVPAGVKKHQPALRVTLGAPDSVTRL